MHLTAPFLAVLSLAAVLSAQQSLEARVDAMFRGCSKPGSPGAVVLVAKGEQILLQKAYGLADLEREVPLSVDSVFDIASTSKQFTAASVLLLVADGKLALADPIGKHVPELPACSAGITLRHLLLHTSGLPDYTGLLAKDHDLVDRTTTEQALAALGAVTELDFPVGSKWEYSNSNYLLLAEVVARVSGMPWAKFTAERIFVPLGMKRSHVHDDCTALVPGRAFSYARGKRGWRWDFSNWEQVGDGAVFTTVGDLLRWARNFETGVVGGEALRAAMAGPGKLDDGTVIDYGMGLSFETVKGQPMVSHSGAWASYRAELLRVPGRGLVVVCLCNRGDLDPSGLCRRIAAAVE
jgi:CubicO group peptidase (beta-lactamase class C family)